MSLKTIKIRVPLHITGFWKPVYSNSPEYSGSLGAGLTITSYLTVSAYRSNSKSLILNNDPISIAPTNYIYSVFQEGLHIEASSEAPLGAGYGMSAALSLALSVAYAILYNKFKSLEEAAKLAHIAEVVSGTGLGDIIAEYYGGFEVRVAPGPPGIGRIIRLSCDPNIKVISIPLGRYDTRSMLREYSAEHAKLAEAALKRLLDNPSLEVFLEEAYRFTKSIFDYNMVEDLIRIVEPYSIGYYFKKRVFTVVCDKKDSYELSKILLEKDIYHIISNIDWGGIRIGDTGESSEERESTY